MVMKPTCARCLTVLVVLDEAVAPAEFCDFCCPEGVLLYETDDVHTFRQRYFDKLYAEGANEFVARFHTLLIGSAPYWKTRRY